MGNDSLDGCLNSFICRSNMERERELYLQVKYGEGGREGARDC